MYFFSAKNNAFYPVTLKAEYEKSALWPEDGIEIDESVFIEYTGQSPNRKKRGVGDGGLPCWVDIPPPSNEELRVASETKKQRLIEMATATIAPLQDAVDLEIATDEEVATLSEWKKYRVLLNRVDVNDINVLFPDAPIIT